MIKNAELEANIESEIKGQLGMAGVDIRELSKNPMLLGLLCVHMKVGNPFPESAHTVLATYLDTRLERDRDRLKQRFNLEPKVVREMSEKVAFCMAADHGLGLTPSRQALVQSLSNLGMPVRDVTRFNTVLDGLEYIKLGRSENDDVIGESRLFTFAHRRFQEYFATCVVLREPDRISIPELLRDARWRETVVVTFQTQPKEKLVPLLNETQCMLGEMVNSIPAELKVTGNDLLEQAEQDTKQDDKSEQLETFTTQFPWPAEALHLLSLIQDGFSRRMSDLPEQIRNDAGTIALSASEKGGPFDKYWALEVAGVAGPKVLLKLLRNAFAGRSQLLKDIAYRQASRLSAVPEDVAKSINQAMVSIFTSGRLSRSYLATRAHVSRLDKAEAFLSTLRLLTWIPRIDLLLHIILLFTWLVLLAGNQLAQLKDTPRSMISDFVFICLTTPLSLLSAKITSTRLARRNPAFLAGYVRTSVLSFMVMRWQLGFLRQTNQPTNSSSKISLSLETILLNIVSWVTTKEHMMFISVVVGIWLIAMWAFFSIAVARYGHFTHRIWWPLMPIVPLVILGKDAKTISNKLWKKLKLVGVTESILCVISPIIFFWAFFHFMNWVVANSFRQRLFLVSFVAVFGGPALRSLLIWLSDRIKWQKRKREVPRIESQEFVDLICKYRTGRYRCQMIREIRLQGALASTPRTLTLISELAGLIDGLQKKRQQRRLSFRRGDLLSYLRQLNSHFKTESPIVIGETVLFDWYKNSNEDLLVSWEADIVDELCQLQNQLRSNSSATAT